SPGVSMSCRTWPSADFTTVPSGTGSSSDSPSAPERRSPMPNPPLPLLRCGEWWYDSSVVTCGSATSTMLPPSPPLPPSGPPRGLNFSRRTETQPLPPLPARRCRVTVSTNVTIWLLLVNRGPSAAEDEGWGYADGASRSPPRLAATESVAELVEAY